MRTIWRYGWGALVLAIACSGNSGDDRGDTSATVTDPTGVQVRQLTGGAPTLTMTAGPALAATNAFLYDMPAYSVSVLVPTP